MLDFVQKLKENLKTKDPIIGIDRFKITSVLIPLISINGECNLVFQIRSNNIPQGGEVCFPGGKFDSKFDKNTRDTAIRETIEEMGIQENQIEYLGRLGHYIAPMGVLVDAHIAKLNIENLQDLNINRNEVEAIFSLSISHLKKNPAEVHYVSVKVDPFFEENGERKLLLPFKKLGLPKRYEKPWGNIKHRIFVYDNDPVIWGITAELINDFLKIV